MCYVYSVALFLLLLILSFRHPITHQPSLQTKNILVIILRSFLAPGAVSFFFLLKASGIVHDIVLFSYSTYRHTASLPGFARSLLYMLCCTSGQLFCHLKCFWQHSQCSSAVITWLAFCQPGIWAFTYIPCFFMTCCSIIILLPPCDFLNSLHLVNFGKSDP